MPLRASSAGRHVTPMRRRISNQRMYWWMRCEGAFAPGRACGSTFSTCQRRSGRHRSRSIQMKTCRATGLALRIPTGRAEDLRKLVRSRDLELIVAARARWFVRAPALKDRGMPKAAALHVVVLDLTHALDA